MWDEIKDNNELTEAVVAAIKESGYRKSWIADQMGISNQNFSRFLRKKGFSIDDANKILTIIGYEAYANIVKKIN